MSTDGHYYVYDNSSWDPEYTADGPLRILLDKPLTVGVDTTTIHVWSERCDSLKRTSMYTHNVPALLKAIPTLQTQLTEQAEDALKTLTQAKYREMD